MTGEFVVHVFPINDGWSVRMPIGKQHVCRRKASAALFAKQAAATADNGRVIFHLENGAVELERVFINHRVVF